jgi:hypothetical protein
MARDPKPCPEYTTCSRPHVWRVTSPASFFHTDPINVEQAHGSSYSCEHHLDETVRWARLIAGEPEVVPLPKRAARGAA